MENVVSVDTGGHLPNLFEGFCLVGAVCCILWAVRENQLGVHTVRVAAGTSLWSEQNLVASNRFYSTAHFVRVGTNGGFVYRTLWTTNEYWHVWRIFY